MTLDKEFRIYRKALLRGVGECVTMLATEAAKRKFRPLVEWACGRVLGYDPQIEGSRALLLYDLINHYADTNPFIDVVEKRFFSSMRKSDGHWLFVQECELLALFSINGNRRARRILERGYDVLYGRLCRIRPARIDAHYILEPDNFAALCEQLLLDAKSVAAQSIFGRIAKDVGRLCLRDAFWNSLAESVHLSVGFVLGDRRLAALVGCIEPSAEVEAYKAALALEDEERCSIEPPTLGYRKVYNQINERGTFGIRYMVRRWRVHGRTKDIEGLARLYRVEKDCDVRAQLLDMFSAPDTRCEGYLPLDDLLRDSASADEALSRAALGVLSHVRNTRVHDMALDRIRECGASYELFEVLAFNYQEEDDEILISASRKLGGLSHDALSVLARLAERNSGVRLSNRMLSHLYDLLYCTCCRERCVREMGRRGLLTNEMLNDCLHDASIEIRCYAARLLKRRAAHNTERSNQ